MNLGDPADLIGWGESASEVVDQSMKEKGRWDMNKGIWEHTWAVHRKS